MRLLTVPGVFRPRSDSRLLARIAAQRTAPGARVVDPFTGSGILAVATALAGAGSVTAIDISRRAVACARLNARLNGTRVRGLRGDMLAPVAGQAFDLIVANPPYLPGAVDEPRGAARAWEGGADGRSLIDRLCREAPAHLAPGGELLIVHSSLCGTAATLAQLEAGGLEAVLLASLRGPLGPLLADRAPRARGARRARSGPTRRGPRVHLRASRAAGRPGGGFGRGGRRVRVRAMAARVTPYRDGPYLVRGEFELTDQEGNVIETRRETIALCRCGGSRRKPFCDGTHKSIDFRADSAAAGRPLR